MPFLNILFAIIVYVYACSYVITLAISLMIIFCNLKMKLLPKVCVSLGGNG